MLKKHRRYTEDIPKKHRRNTEETPKKHRNNTETLSELHRTHTSLTLTPSLPQRLYTLRITDEKGFVVTRKVVNE